jgi:hypothetical protein
MLLCFQMFRCKRSKRSDHNCAQFGLELWPSLSTMGQSYSLIPSTSHPLFKRDYEAFLPPFAAARKVFRIHQTIGRGAQMENWRKGLPDGSDVCMNLGTEAGLDNAATEDGRTPRTQAPRCPLAGLIGQNQQTDILTGGRRGNRGFLSASSTFSVDAPGRVKGLGARPSRSLWGASRPPPSGPFVTQGSG